MLVVEVDSHSSPFDRARATFSINTSFPDHNTINQIRRNRVMPDNMYVFARLVGLPQASSNEISLP